MEVVKYLSVFPSSKKVQFFQQEDRLQKKSVFEGEELQG
jgi:hypothetical protein